MNMRTLQMMGIVTLLAVSSGPLMAQQNERQQDTLDRAQAAARAQQQVKGRVLRVDQAGNKYRVKVLKKSGRVVSVDVDKRSGQVRQTQNKESER